MRTTSGLCGRTSRSWTRPSSCRHHDRRRAPGGRAGRYDAAEFLLKRSIAVAPPVSPTTRLGHFQCRRRQYDDAIANYRASLELDPTNLTTWPNLLFALDLHPYATPQLRLAERRRFDELALQAADRCSPAPRERPGPRAHPARRLRLGRLQAALGCAWLRPGRSGPRFGAVEVHLYDVDQSPENADDQVASWYREHDRFIRGTTSRGLDDAARWPRRSAPMASTSWWICRATRPAGAR
jgi:tetratricopeptide (TPR) repeat protein